MILKCRVGIPEMAVLADEEGNASGQTMVKNLGQIMVPGFWKLPPESKLSHTSRGKGVSRQAHKDTGRHHNERTQELWLGVAAGLKDQAGATVRGNRHALRR